MMSAMRNIYSPPSSSVLAQEVYFSPCKGRGRTREEKGRAEGGGEMSNWRYAAYYKE